MQSPRRLAIIADLLFPTIREWVRDGEEWYACSPLVLVVRQELQTEGVANPTDDHIGDRLEAYFDGTLEPNELNDLVERALAIDAVQRSNGYANY